MSKFKNIYENYLYEMSNIIYDESGVPVTLFFSPQPSNHKIRPIRFKLSPHPKRFIPDDAMDFLISYNDNNEMYIQSVNNETLNSKLTKKLLSFITLNIDAITDFWEHKLTATQFGNSIKKLN